jgi:environmental stress-induced protein Ves
VRVIHLGDAPRERWRNDGGWTREIVRAPEGEADYDWRLSVAEVESAGPFSHFGGCDRILVLLGGEGMALQSADSTVVLRAPGEFLRFAGELPIDAALVAGPTTDLNLIWRRDHCNVVMVPATSGATDVAGGGAHEVVIAFSLATHATRVGDLGERLTIDAEGREIAFVIAPLAPG